MTQTIEQLVAEEQQQHLAYEAKTIAAKIGGVEYTIADLRKAFDAVCDAADWKSPVAVFVPHQSVAIVCKAIEWFQGCRPSLGGIQPLTGKVLVTSRGYVG